MVSSFDFPMKVVNPLIPPRLVDFTPFFHVFFAKPGPGWKQFVPAGAAPTVETVQKVDALRTAAWAKEEHDLGVS